MNVKILGLAGVLVVLAGILFVFPFAPASDMEAVACPGVVCVASPGSARGGGLAAWGVTHHCYVNPQQNLNTQCAACCTECGNYGIEEDHIVGLCVNYGCGAEEEYNLNCPV